MAYYFLTPFGTSGDKTAIPVPVQGDGSISYTQGYGPKYSAPRDTDPAALTIERNKMNQLFYAITSNIQQYQQHGVPEYITSADNGGSPYGYSKYAQVRYDNGSEVANYVSLVASNTALPTDTTKWAQLRIDPAYLGIAQTFTAIQTFSAAGTPVVINSTNSTALKISLKDNGTNRGGLGASSSWSLVAYLSDLTTAAGGWDASGNLIPGAAATYDLGSASAQYRAAYANRYEVMGSTVPANGIYLSAANTIGFAANSANRMILTTSALSSSVNDGRALGTSSLGWSDLFLATGGVVDWGGGNVFLTHSTDTLTASLTNLTLTPVSSGTSGPILTLSSTRSSGVWVPGTDYMGQFIVTSNESATPGSGTKGAIRVGPSDASGVPVDMIFYGSTSAANNVEMLRLRGSDSIGLFAVGASSPYLAVTGSTAPANGIYLQAANIVGISANSILSSRFRTVASAVNYIDHIAAATANNPSVLAAGGDTNITLTIGGKGTGGVLVTNTLSTPNVVVTGTAIPTNGLYLPAANTPAIAVNGAIGVAFGAGTIGPNATQRHTLPAVTNDIVALLAATQSFTNKVVNGVTLTTGGSASNFLNEQGNYVPGVSAAISVKNIVTMGTLAANTTYTVAHGLGVTPFNVQPAIVCNTANIGYSIGDLVYMNHTDCGSSGSDMGLACMADSTNVTIIASTAGSMVLLNKSSRVLTNFTLASWTLQARVMGG